METLLASSGSTLGHGPTTRTHACRRPPKRERGRSRQAHTHNIRCSTSVERRGPPSGFAPLAGLSAVGFGGTRRVRTDPPPSPTHLLFPRVSLRASGAAPTVSPSEWREYARTPRRVRGSHKAVPPHCPSPSPSPTPALPRQRGYGDRLFPCPCHRRRRPSSAHSYPPVQRAGGDGEAQTRL